MLRFIAFVLLSAAMELLLLIRNKKRNAAEEEDPMALPCTAYKVKEPDFNYIPGRTTYDEKSGRYVTDWKYEWTYQGVKHTMMFCDNPGSQYEHYIPTFPDELRITIHKKTGNFYVSKTVRAAKSRSLFILLVPMAVSWIITGLIFR
jgi:hypothetical protein